MQYTRYQQYVILYVLERIKEADLIIDPREVLYFDEMLSAFCISVEEIESLESLDLIKCRDCIIEMNSEQKKDVRRIFEKMASIDEIIDPREIAVIEMVLGSKTRKDMIAR